MMYSELLALTDDKATYEQFLDIESVYTKKESMTQKQAASLWRRRYGEKSNKPLPEYLKMVKDAIRDLKGNRDFLVARIEQEAVRFDEKISEYDPNEYWGRQSIETLKKQKSKRIGELCEEMGNDSAIYIIYKDGSDLSATGEEIVTGEITPKMQGIVYAMYNDGWMEYDTYTGLLVDADVNYFGDLSMDKGIKAREGYYEMIEEMFAKLD